MMKHLLVLAVIFLSEMGCNLAKTCASKVASIGIAVVTLSYFNTIHNQIILRTLTQLYLEFQIFCFRIKKTTCSNAIDKLQKLNSVTLPTLVGFE
jgi:hypothetical protein